MEFEKIDFKKRLLEVNDLYNYVFSKERTLDEAKWEFIENPIEHKFNYGIIDKDKIIGHWGILPHNLVINNEVVKGGKIENTMINPSYKGKGYYKKFELYCSENLVKDNFVLWSISTERAIEMRKKLGYSHIGYFKGYEQVIVNFNFRTLAYLIRFFLGEIHNPIKAFKNLAKRFKNNSQRLSKSLRIVEFKEFSSIFDKIISYKVNTISREKKYMKWRFDDNPNLEYKYILSEKNDFYFIYTVKNNSLVVHDLGNISNGELALPTKMNIQQICVFCKNYGFNKVKIKSLKNSIFAQNLLSEGFFIGKKNNEKKQGAFVIKGLTEDIDLSKWYFTNIFSEGIH